GGPGGAAGDGQGGAVLPVDRRVGGPQPRSRPAGDLPDGRGACPVGRPGGLLPGGGGGAGPVPRAGAALGGGPLLPQGGQRRGEGVRGATAAGPAARPCGVRDRGPAATVEGREVDRRAPQGGPLGTGVPGEQQGAYAV